MANIPSMMDSWNLATSGLPAPGTNPGFTPAQGGTPFSTGNPYNLTPQLPAYTTDTTTTTGADLWGQLKTAGGPGVAGNLQQGIGAIGSHIAGQIAPSTVGDIGNYAAQIGAGGMGMGPGAPGSDVAYLKLLGLKAEDLTKQGLGEQNALFSAFPYQQGQTTTTKTDLSGVQSILNALRDERAAAWENMNALGAGMGNWGGRGGFNMPLAWNQQPTDMSWFYKPWGPTGGGTPTAKTNAPTDWWDIFDTQAKNPVDPANENWLDTFYTQATNEPDIGSMMGGTFGDWYGGSGQDYYNDPTMPEYYGGY